MLLLLTAWLNYTNWKNSDRLRLLQTEEGFQKYKASREEAVSNWGA